MHILQLEQERILLKDKLTEGFSNQAKLLFIYNFFEKTLSTKNKNLIESYLPEFIPEYIRCLKSWTSFGFKPRIHESLIEQAEKIFEIGLTTNYDAFEDTIKRLRDDFAKMHTILDGKNLEAFDSKPYFPLLEEEAIKETGMTIGVIESVTIKINKAKSGNRFIIVPSEKEIEEKISEQVKQSWFNALKVAKKYIRKINPYHEVIISFDNKAGFCKGNSLGTALTLSFIEEILKTYNSPVAIKVGEGIAFTGGIDELGRITNTSTEIIKQKTELIFFPSINLFVVPKEEETTSNEKIDELKKEFPHRDLRVIGIEDLNDLLNRRNIVEIKKQLIVVRSGKFVRKNWAVFSLMLIIVGMVYFAGFWDLDTNPAYLKNEKNWLIVQNKNNKILWKKRLGFDVTNPIFSTMPNITQKIVDINLDGINEVILAREYRDDDQSDSPNGRITCFSSKGDIIWENHFNDEIKTKEMVHSKDYFSMIIDTVTINNTKALLCFADNVLYPGAVYFINVKNGKRTGSTLWNYGHLHSGKIGDFNRDGEKELIMFGLNNAFKRSIVFSIDINKIEGQLPTYEKKEFLDIKLAEFNKYVLLPNTDYNKFLTGNYNSTVSGYFLLNQDSTKIINFLMEGKAPDLKGIMIELNGDLELTKIDLSLEFGIARDSLVSAGKLSLPYTHTEKYQNVLWDQIECWNRDTK